jgi:hypothetical protein
VPGLLLKVARVEPQQQARLQRDRPKSTPAEMVWREVTVESIDQPRSSANMLRRIHERVIAFTD